MSLLEGPRRMASALLLGLGLLGAGIVGLASGSAAASPGSSAPVVGLGNITTSKRLVTTSSSQDARVLIEQARARGFELTVEEMTAARLISSEHGSGSVQEMALFVFSELNRARAKGISLTASLTAKTAIYGRQGRHDGVNRPAATRKNPTARHLEVAKAVLQGTVADFSKGATRFFDPIAQRNTHRRYMKEGTLPFATCHPRGTLKKWSYALGSCPGDQTQSGKSQACCKDGMPNSDAKRGSRPLAWIGDVAGVNALRVMAMGPSEYGSTHDEIYLRADALIATIGS